MDRQLLLLGLIRQQEMHGYQLSEFIEEEMHFCTNLKKSTAYYILDKLAQQGYVEVEQEQVGNRPPRHVYQITEAGEAFFMELLRQNLATHTTVHYPTDIGIAFMDQLPVEQVVELLHAKRDAVSAELQVLQEANVSRVSLQHVLEHNRRMLQAELNWLDELMKSLSDSTF